MTRVRGLSRVTDTEAEFDLIVVGLGAMGAAVTFHAKRRGMSVLGIDRFDPPHGFGSTHAETRISRLAVAEGPAYLPFVARSHELWREIETLSGEELLFECGGYIVTAGSSGGERFHDFVSATDRIAREASIPFDVLEPADVRAAHPELLLPDDVRVGFAPTAGVVMAERAVAAQLDLARQAGAVVRTNTLVSAIEPHIDHVAVITSAGTTRAQHVVLATGPWFGDLASPVYADLVTVTRQVVFWFEADDLGTFSTERFPFVMWIGETDEDYVAIFPTPPGGTQAVKVMGEQFLVATTPADVDRTVSLREISDFYELQLRPKLAGVGPTCVRSAVCMYASTPGERFLIDSDVRSDRVTVMSACSGHGFKHSTALGEAVAQRIDTGTSDLDLDPFRYSTP